MSPLVLIAISLVAGIFFQHLLCLSPIFLLSLSVSFLFVCIFNISDRKNFLIFFLALIFFVGAASFSLRGPMNEGRPSKVEGHFLKPLGERLNRVCSLMLPHPYSDLLGSLVLGASAAPPPGYMKDAYRKVGLVHLLVASGQQISLLFGFIMGIGRMISLSTKTSALIASGFGIVFSIVAGGGPSIIRALIMSEMALAAPIFDREGDPLSSLSFSVLMLLIFDPRLLFDIGFQLSFCATFSLLYVAPIFDERLNERLPKGISGILSISIAPFLVTMPVIAYNFSQLSIISVLANALVLPWIEALVVLGFISLLVGILVQPLSLVFSGPIFFMIKFLNFLVFSLAELPFAFTFISQPSPPLVLCYYILMFAFIFSLKNKTSLMPDRKKALIFFLLLFSLVTWHFAIQAGERLSGKVLSIDVLDVGQGDSIFISTPSGKSVLIDGGEKYYGRSVVVPLLAKKGVKEIGVVVLTHPHGDHLGGLLEVVKQFKVDLVIDSGQPHTSRMYMEFLALVKQKNIKYRIALAGDAISLGDSIEADILWPEKKKLSGTMSDLNNNSIAIKLVYNKFSFLLMGDLGFAGEAGLMKRGGDLRSDVIKVGHHGSGTSTSKELLIASKPIFAVISVGAGNRYGHPSGKALSRLRDGSIKILRTDLNGRIEIRSNGEEFTISPSKSI